MNHPGKSFGKFLILWSGGLISAIVSGFTSFGLGVYVFEQTGKASATALVMLLAFQRGNEKRAVELAKKAKKLMEKMGLKGLEQRNITQVSGGQLQRAGICRALTADPEIIYGDEPTGALNSKSDQEIMNILIFIAGAISY